MLYTTVINCTATFKMIGILVHEGCVKQRQVSVVCPTHFTNVLVEYAYQGFAAGLEEIRLKLKYQSYIGP